MAISHQAIQPLNVTGAAFLIQIILLGMLTITVFIMQSGESRLPRFPERPVPNVRHLAFLILGFTLFSFAILLASEEVIAVFGRLFEGHGLPIGNFKARSALSIVFSLDILLFGILIYQTGGSKDSPFTPVLFMLPSLAIFLRESPERFVLYAVFTGLVFLLLLIPRFSRQAPDENPHYRYSFAFVAIACLALSLFIGYITRPVPIEQLAEGGDRTASDPTVHMGAAR